MTPDCQKNLTIILRRIKVFLWWLSLIFYMKCKTILLPAKYPLVAWNIHTIKLNLIFSLLNLENILWQILLKRMVYFSEDFCYEICILKCFSPCYNWPNLTTLGISCSKSVIYMIKNKNRPIFVPNKISFFWVSKKNVCLSFETRSPRYSFKELF